MAVKENLQLLLSADLPKLVLTHMNVFSSLFLQLYYPIPGKFGLPAFTGKGEQPQEQRYPPYQVSVVYLSTYLGASHVGLDQIRNVGVWSDAV